MNARYALAHSFACLAWLPGPRHTDRLVLAIGRLPQHEFVEPRPSADPDVAARKLVEIASTIEPVQLS
jgi:hypothetical protein